ncbi:hypothetical protein K9M47_04380 [Candidatus Gracilibacteria bacterium]|nr:hypothetical protein [Candidatus Gracilibacteria bacterium]
MNMSSKVIPSDQLYRTTLSFACQNAFGLLQSKKRLPDLGLDFDYIFRVLDDMENERPFEVPYGSVSIHYRLTEDAKFQHRREVWEIIYATLTSDMQNLIASEDLTAYFHDRRLCATFLKKKIVLIKRCIDFEKWKAECILKITSMGMSVSFSGSPSIEDWDVNIACNPEKTGENAKEFTKAFLVKLIERLNETAT